MHLAAKPCQARGGQLTQHGFQAGRLAVYGDSSCLDSSHRRTSCQGLLLKLIKWVAEVGGPPRDPCPARRWTTCPSGGGDRSAALPRCAGRPLPAQACGLVAAAGTG